MQVFIPIYQADTKNIYFGEKRKNVILDGNFVKLIYSTECFEMNGLHLFVEFLRSVDNKAPNQVGANSYIPQYISPVPASSEDLLSKVIIHPLPIAWTTVNSIASRRIPDAGAICFSESLIRKQPPKQNAKPNPSTTKLFAEIDVSLNENIKQMQRLIDIEHDIIDHYIQLNAPHKNGVYNLKSQLMNGSFRYTKLTESVDYDSLTYEDKSSTLLRRDAVNNVSLRHHSAPYAPISEAKSDSERRSGLAPNSQIIQRASRDYVLKISGIWETSTSVGITLKFTRI